MCIQRINISTVQSNSFCITGFKLGPKDMKKRPFLTYHRMIEAFNFAAARETYLTDPKFNSRVTEVTRLSFRADFCDCGKTNQSNNSGQSHQTLTAQWTNHNSNQIHAADAERGKLRTSKSQLVLVFVSQELRKWREFFLPITACSTIRPTKAQIAFDTKIENQCHVRKR